ncbi:hypothetical protein V7S43_004894 [Phytophthora oleae]|uniref:Uncharacterized protein n=1 Tax=Phytophthora oleae TaxID=2107226 RepID=A0ABD3FX83_9STRA
MFQETSRFGSGYVKEEVSEEPTVTPTGFISLYTGTEKRRPDGLAGWGWESPDAGYYDSGVQAYAAAVPSPSRAARPALSQAQAGFPSPSPAPVLTPRPMPAPSPMTVPGGQSVSPQ